MPLCIKDGYASYDEREVFELPVRKLLKKSPGDFCKLTEDNLEFILGYLMEEPSPFNSLLPDLKWTVQQLRNADLFVVHLDHISIETPIYRDDPEFEQCHIYCNRTLDLILKSGIPAKLGYSLWELENDEQLNYALDVGARREKKEILELSLRWAAARGPWPEQNETNMCEARLKTCLQCVYNSLLDHMRLAIANSNVARKNQMFVAMKSNLTFLSYAWDGLGHGGLVGEWRA